MVSAAALARGDDVGLQAELDGVVARLAGTVVGVTDVAADPATDLATAARPEGTR